MPTQNFTLGMNAKAYYSATALDPGATTPITPATATWVEMTNIKNLTQNLSTDQADITTRANNGWKATAATLKDGEITFTMQWKPGDAGFDAIQTAWMNATEIAIAAMDGDIATSANQGLASNFTVTNFSRSEQLTEAITVDVTIKPSSQTQWYKVV